MAKTVASPDITILDYSVLLDLSLATPTISIANLSTEINSGILQYMFELYSPSGTPLYSGEFANGFTNFTFPNIQQIFGQVEFSVNNGYVVTVSVKDSNDLITSLTKMASVCLPNGNNGKNNFGAALVDIEVKCGQAKLLVKDRTNLIYKSLAGVRVSSTLELTYPTDNNGNALAPVTVTTLPALLPIKYEGEGHEIYVANIYDYDLGDLFKVRIRYSFKKIFPVWCNVNLEPLFCEISKVVAILDKDCFDSAENRIKYQKLTLANAKLMKAVTGILQPLSNFDVPAIVNEIKELLVIECDCCRPQGIADVTAAVGNDAQYVANVTCGDMTAGFANDGSGNIVLNLSNKIYAFAMSSDPLSSAAFGFSTSDAGNCNKAVILRVSKVDLATEMLSTIRDNATLLNILNDLTQKAQLGCSGLNGGDAINLSTCNYNVVLNTATPGKTLNWILIDGSKTPAPGGILLSATSTLQTFLNSLGKGVFTVTNTGASTTISSTANTHLISMVQIQEGSTPKAYSFNSDCGLICNILQKVLDYLNQINLVKIQAGVPLTICQFKPDGTVLNTSYLATQSASVIASAMAESLCNVVNYAKDKLLSCTNLKALFATFTTGVPNPNGADIAFMSVSGKCQQVPLKNLAMAVFGLAVSDVDVKNQFCLITPCTSVSNCSPVSNLVGVIADNSASYTWSPVAGAIRYKWSKDGVTWLSAGGTSAIVTGLTPATDYTFRVYPVYAFGDGIDCLMTVNFTTTNILSACAAPANLIFNSVNESSFVASWASVLGAGTYQYSLNGAGWVSVGLDLSIRLTGLIANTFYNFSVRAIIGGIPCAEVTTDSVTTTYLVPRLLTWEPTAPSCITTLTCAAGYTLSPDGLSCVRESDTPATPHTGGGTPGTATAVTSAAWNKGGAKLFYSGFPISGSGVMDENLITPHLWLNGVTPGDVLSNTTDSRMNAAGVWSTATVPINEKIGFARKFYSPTATSAFIAMAADNDFKFTLNAEVLVETIVGGLIAGTPNFNYLNIYPVTLVSGWNYIEMLAWNEGGVAGFCAEVYGCTRAQLVAVTSIPELEAYILFSTKDMVGQLFDNGDTQGYSCAIGTLVNTVGTTYVCRTIDTATPVTANTGMKSYANRRRLENGVPDGTTEINNNAGVGPFFPPVSDPIACP